MTIGQTIKRLLTWASPAEQQANAKIIFGFFSPEMILGPYGGIAAVVNASAESLLTPTIMGDNDHAYALWQMHLDRIEPIREHTGINIASNPAPDVLSQCHAIWYEMNATEKRARDAIRAAVDSADATKAWCALFERPNPKLNQPTIRAAKAAVWAKQFGVS